MDSNPYLVACALYFVCNGLPALWAAYDAAKNRISTDAKPYGKINGAFAWFLGCVLFPFVGILYYLIRRSLVLDEKRCAAAMQTA